MESDALIVFNASGETNGITATTEGQEQKMSKRLQTTGVPNLQYRKSQSRNTGVLKATSGNAAKQKSKTETRHNTKRSTTLITLKMIARQGVDEKSPLEE